MKKGLFGRKVYEKRNIRCMEWYAGWKGHG